MTNFLLKLLKKAPKWPLQYANFSVGACPWTPLKAFLVLKLLKIKFVEKTLLEKMMNIGAPSLKKNSAHAPDMKHFQKACLRSFPALNIFVSS